MAEDKRDYAADRRLCDEISAGPTWSVMTAFEDDGYTHEVCEDGTLFDTVVCATNAPKFAGFIAQSREGWPAALAEIERLKNGVTRLRDRLICDLDAITSADTTERTSAYEDCLESTLRRIDRYIREVGDGE